MPSLPDTLRIDAVGITLLFDLRRGHVELVHIGGSLPRNEVATQVCDAQRRGRHESQPDVPFPRSILPQTGWGYGGSPAVTLLADQNQLPSRFVLVEAEGGDQAVRFRFDDAVSGAALSIGWRIASSGMIVATAQMTNRGPAPICIASLASLALPLPHWATHVMRFSGRWASEMHGRRTRLQGGDLAAASHGGRPGFKGGGWIRFEEEATSEVSGRTLAAHLGWSGDHMLSVGHDDDGTAMLLMGARLDIGEVVLAPGQSWTAPDALIAVGDAGRADTRAKFHAHAVGETLPATAASPRKVHLNSWEALGFNLDQRRLMALADDAGSLGVERFVLDDGWFLGRRDDKSGLGDWTADPLRFSDGLNPLIAHVHSRGMDFGLWVEPEMVSPDSALCRAHPDWCVHVPAQPRPAQRSQLVLDITRDEVRRHVFEAIDTLLRDHAIAYLKWDHNRDLFPLAGRGQAYVRALYGLLDTLRLAHPHVEIESCASGGGRVDFEIMKRCTRFWASDNNDAIDRLRINAGWLDFLPLRAIGNHVGPSPNPITGRRLSMDFRAKIAIFGHMGIEADPAAMPAQDRETLAAHIALYKAWRGDLHAGRLAAIGCPDPGVFGWFAWSGSRGLALAAQTGFAEKFNVPPVCLPSLPRDDLYRVRLLEPWPPGATRYLAVPELWREGIVLSGRALADGGLALPLVRPETAWLIAVETLP